MCRNCAPILRVAVNSRYCSSGSNCCRRVILIRRRFIERARVHSVSEFHFFFFVFRCARREHQMKIVLHCSSIKRMNICRHFFLHSDSIMWHFLFFWVFSGPINCDNKTEFIVFRAQHIREQNVFIYEEKKKLRSSLAKNKQLKCLKSFTYSACFHPKIRTAEK